MGHKMMKTKYAARHPFNCLHHYVSHRSVLLRQAIFVKRRVLIAETFE